MAGGTAARIIDAARARLQADGYAGLSTRGVADEAGVPLSQIHYHFGGKQGLVLALLAHENERLVRRQREMYEADAPLSDRYEQACGFLDDDLASGYVRVLQEMIAAGWSEHAVAQQVVVLLDRWFDLLTEVVTEAEQRLGSLGPFTAEDVAMLVGMAFLGAEELLLLDGGRRSAAARIALRTIGDVVKTAEARAATGGG